MLIKIKRQSFSPPLLAESSDENNLFPVSVKLENNLIQEIDLRITWYSILFVTGKNIVSMVIGVYENWYIGKCKWFRCTWNEFLFVGIFSFLLPIDVSLPADFFHLHQPTSTFLKKMCRVSCRISPFGGELKDFGGSSLGVGGLRVIKNKVSKIFGEE